MIGILQKLNMRQRLLHLMTGVEVVEVVGEAYLFLCLSPPLCVIRRNVMAVPLAELPALRFRDGNSLGFGRHVKKDSQESPALEADSGTRVMMNKYRINNGLRVTLVPVKIYEILPSAIERMANLIESCNPSIWVWA